MIIFKLRIDKYNETVLDINADRMTRNTRAAAPITETNKGQVIELEEFDKIKAVNHIREYVNKQNKFLSEEVLENLKIVLEKENSIEALLHRKKISIRVLDLNNPIKEIIEEFYVITSFEHKFIITPIGFHYKETNILWIVYEFYEKSLETLINEKMLSFENKLRILKNILELLQYIHSKQQICLVLNTKNIRFSRSNIMKLVNLHEYANKSLKYHNETKSFFDIYDSPEVLLNNQDKINHCSDIWSLGILMIILFSNDLQIDFNDLINHYKENKIPLYLFDKVENIFVKGLVISILRLHHKERPTIKDVIEAYNMLIDILEFETTYKIINNSNRASLI